MKQMERCQLSFFSSLAFKHPVVQKPTVCSVAAQLNITASCFNGLYGLAEMFPFVRCARQQMAVLTTSH
jgi:hypothetical protein